MIQFLNAKNVFPVEIQWQKVEVYGEGAVNEGNVRKWCWLFKEGRTEVHDEWNGCAKISCGKFSSIFRTVSAFFFLCLKKFLVGQSQRSDQETKRHAGLTERQQKLVPHMI